MEEKNTEFCIAKYSFLLLCFFSAWKFLQLPSHSTFLYFSSFACYECALCILLTQNTELQCHPHSKLWTGNIQIQVLTVTCSLFQCKYRSSLNILNIGNIIFTEFAKDVKNLVKWNYFDLVQTHHLKKAVRLKCDSDDDMPKVYVLNFSTNLEIDVTLLLFATIKLKLDPSSVNKSSEVW